MIFRMRLSTECSWELHWAPDSELLHDIARESRHFHIVCLIFAASHLALQLSHQCQGTLSTQSEITPG